MKAHALLLMLGLAACGGDLSREDGDGGKGSALAEGGTRPMDARADEDSGVGTYDASHVCTKLPVTATQCLACNGGWSCPAIILPRCPTGTAQGAMCFQFALDASDPTGQCFECPNGGVGDLWGCQGSLGWTLELSRPCSP
jgi:hypothetical protein